MFQARFAFVTLLLTGLVFGVFPTDTSANGFHGAAFPVFRPVCAVGGLNPGCFAPLRKTAVGVGIGVRAVGRGAIRTARFVGRVGIRVGRGVFVGARFATRTALFAARPRFFGRRFGL